MGAAADMAAVTDLLLCTATGSDVTADGPIKASACVTADFGSVCAVPATAGIACSVFAAAACVVIAK